MLPKSIRWRLQAWQGFLLAFVLGGLGVTAYQLHRTNQLSLVDDELERRLAVLGAEVRGLPPPGAFRGGAPGRRPFPDPGQPGPPPEPGLTGPPVRGTAGEFRSGPRGRPEGFGEPREIRLSPLAMLWKEESDPEGFYFLVWSRGGTRLSVSSNAPPSLAVPKREGMPLQVRTRTRGAAREAFQFTEVGECILVGRSIAADLAGWRRFAWLLAAAGAGILAMGLGGGWWLAGRALRPVEDISATASRIAEGNLADRINVADTDSELGRLAALLNHTFARLEAAFAQQRQFTADASHELRTPLTVLISEAQSTLARERGAAEYREAVANCLEVAQQMRRLAESLLALARLDGGQEALERQPFALDDRVRACAERLEPLARGQGIRLRVEPLPVMALGDADRVEQVITNLLANAIHYNREHGEVRITTRADTSAAVLEVSDTGPGIAEEDLPHVFDRFYRADKSRGRAEGRTGLGLAICRAIVVAHGGEIRVSSQVGVGSVFTVSLPVATGSGGSPGAG